MSRSMYGSSPKAAGESAHDWVRELAPLRERSIKAIIDVSNKCNLRCRMCHFSFDDVFHQPAQHMRPDCRVEAPFGSLLNPAASFEEIWRGKEFTDLRQRIINRDPPSMCVTCAHFINRNVDDPAYFVPR